MHNLSTLKVCFVAGTLTQGGAERELYHILQAFCQAGASPRLLTLDQGQFWEDKIKALGVDVVYVGVRSRLKRLLRVLKEARKDPPDVLQSQHFYTNAYAGLAARLLSVSGIGAMQNDGRSEVSACGPVGGRLNLHLPGIIAANSRMAMRYAVANGVPASRLYLLPNVVDTDWFTPSAPSTGGPVKLLAVGRLVKQKRLDRFISILARLRKDPCLDVTGLIVGAGRQNEDLGPELKNQAANLGLLPDIVQFRGAVADTRPVYREADVCVLTSDFEGTPNVLMEAMACGLPVVSSRVGGIPDIVRHGQTGFLLEPDDIDGFVAALGDLARNARLRTEMGQSARAYAEQNHSPERLPAYLSGLYKLALPARRLSTPEIRQGTPI